MSASRHDNEAIFHAARAVADAGRRREYVREACGGDEARIAHLEALLAAADTADSLLDRPAECDTLAVVEPSTTENGGTAIGPYRLLEPIGEGGMGTVWMAEQTEPVKRLVAVKLIKAGMDSAQVVARFEAERQALALMDHPNIARVLDAGATSAGRPYFVMELVEGVPITQYCDGHRLTPRERLELFIPICQAVQHAHQKGVIHRDLKPSNVLVALYDGKPVPKVIDFGVAKATEQRLTERTSFTQCGALVGTLEYMSPEQAAMSALGVDTRSDIYSLGVLLYELLTGGTPLTCQRMKEAAFAEILRMIKEEEPPRPSARLNESGEALASIAASRHTEPAKLTKLVRGELDWIVMKCLEKDRNRRYETAKDIAADVRRYLNDEPVQACPPSVGYRMRKFARRNKGPVLAAAVIFLLLVGGIVGTTVGLVQAERARDTAEKRLVQIENGIDVLGSIFDNLDPWAEEKEGRPLRAILGDRLDLAAAALEGEAVGDPLIVARLQDRLGHTYLGLGHAARAEALFTKAVATRQAHLGANDPLTLASRHNQALAYEAAGKRNEAIRQFEQVRDARAMVLGADHLDTLSTLNELAAAYWSAGKLTLAIPLLEQVRDGRVKQLGDDHDHTLATLQNLAGAYSTADRDPEAIALAEKVRDAWEKKHGEDHPHAIAAVCKLAHAYQAGFKMRQALALFEQARDNAVRKLGLYHPVTLKTKHGLAHMYRAYQRTSEAIALFEEVREGQLMTLGGHHPSTVVTLGDLGLAYRDAGEHDKALPHFQQAARGVEKLAFAHDQAGRIIHNLARCHEQLKQFEPAEDWRRKALPVVKAKDGPASFRYANFWGLAGLGSNLVQQKKYDAAEPIVRESLAILQEHFPGWDAFRAESLLGAALLGQEKYADAEPHLVRGYQGLKEMAKSPGHKFIGQSDRENLAEALERLVRFYDATNRPDEAATGRKELEAQSKATDNAVKPIDK